MGTDDQAAATPPDWDEWVRAQLAEPEAAAMQAHRSHRRRRIALAGAVTVLALAAVGGAYWVTAGGGSHRTPDAAPPAAASVTPSAAASATVPDPAVSVRVSLPANAPSSLPSLLARPVISLEQAFPDEQATVASGATYRRVDVRRSSDCSQAVAPDFDAIFQQPGNACLQAAVALFTDAGKKSRITVTVLSFRQAQGMGAAFAMASIDPVKYQVVSLDPPVGSDVPPADPGGSGVFKRLATVRSVVFVNGQWADAKNQDEAGITTQVDDLLGYADAKVAAYEQG